jgi:hypothetical protein
MGLSGKARPPARRDGRRWNLRAGPMEGPFFLEHEIIRYGMKSCDFIGQRYLTDPFQILSDKGFSHHGRFGTGIANPLSKNRGGSLQDSTKVDESGRLGGKVADLRPLE